MADPERPTPARSPSRARAGWIRTATKVSGACTCGYPFDPRRDAAGGATSCVVFVRSGSGPRILRGNLVLGYDDLLGRDLDDSLILAIPHNDRLAQVLMFTEC